MKVAEAERQKAKQGVTVGEGAANPEAAKKKNTRGRGQVVNTLQPVIPKEIPDLVPVPKRVQIVRIIPKPKMAPEEIPEEASKTAPAP